MDNIENQVLKILKKLSLNEQTKNQALKRQTERLMLALLYMKAVISTSGAMALTKG